MNACSRLSCSCPSVRLAFSGRGLPKFAGGGGGGGRIGVVKQQSIWLSSACIMLRAHFSLRAGLNVVRRSDLSATTRLISSFASGGTTCKDAAGSSESDITSGLHEIKMISELEHALGTPFDTGPQAAPPKPLVIVISGPSGVGKDAVIKRLQEVRKEIHFVVTATTRQKRPGERHGVDYYFISKEEFKDMIEKNELLEHALVYGDYKGIPKKQVRECLTEGRDVVLRVDVQGAATVRSILGSNAIFIYIVAESEFALVKRLIERRTETMEKLLVRVATARDELKRLGEFDYVVVNADGQLEKSVHTVCAIIDAEKSRVVQKVANI